MIGLRREDLVDHIEGLGVDREAAESVAQLIVEQRTSVLDMIDAADHLDLLDLEEVGDATGIYIDAETTDEDLREVEQAFPEKGDLSRLRQFMARGTHRWDTVDHHGRTEAVLTPNHQPRPEGDTTC